MTKNAKKWYSRPTLADRQCSVESLESLLRLAASERTLADLPRLILEDVKSVFDPDIACVYTGRPATSDFIATATTPPAFWQHPDNRGYFARRRYDAGSIAVALETNEVQFVRDAQLERSNGRHVPFSSDDGSEIIIPVSAHDHLSLIERPVACVVMTRRWGRPFTEEDFAKARLVQPAIVAAFNRAVAKDRRDRRLDFLKSLGHVLDNSDVESVLTSFLESLVHIADVRVAVLWLRTSLLGVSDVLVARAVAPAILDGRSLSVDSLDDPVVLTSEALTYNVVSGARSLRFEKPLGEPRLANRRFAKENDLRWFVSLPILDSSQEVQAVLDLWPQCSSESMDEASIHTLESYVSPLRTLLRLMELLQEERELGTHASILDAVLNDVSNPQAPWDALATTIRDMISCEHCSIFLVDSRDESLRLKGTTGLQGLGSRYAFRDVQYRSRGMTPEVVRRGKPYIYYQGIDDEISRKHESVFREPTQGRSKSILFAPLLDGTNGHAVGVLRCTNKRDPRTEKVTYFTRQDITQLSSFAHALAILRRQTHWFADRGREWEYTMYSLHHELLSPVDAFTVLSKWLVKHLSLPVSERNEPLMLKRIRDIRNNAVLVDAVVHGMGRLEQSSLVLKRAPENLAEIVNGSIAPLRPLARSSRIDIRVEYFGVPRVCVDATQMMRVIFNLLRNAIKYHDWTKSTRYVRFRAREASDTVILSVEDNGIGVPVADGARVFEKFERGSNAREAFPEGSGLGLYYCQQIVTAHPQGRLLLVSHADPTVFELWLPKE